MVKDKNKKDEFPIFDTSEIEKSLKKMVDDMLKMASDVAKEYQNLDVSELAELSGSVTEIAENSPFLNEIFEGESWKNVMNMGSGSTQTSGSTDDASE